MIIFFLLFINNFLFADIGHGILEQHQNKFSVSTSIQNGLNIVKAINANFADVICVEQDKMLFEHSKFVIAAYFRNGLPNTLVSYNILYGPTAPALKEATKKLDAPCTFILCSHLPEPDHPEKINTILDELEVIKNHHIKAHTILIDYINWAGTVWFGSITLQSIKDKILSINPNYKFKFEKGGLLERQENAVLVAYF